MPVHPANCSPPSPILSCGRRLPLQSPPTSWRPSSSAQNRLLADLARIASSLLPPEGDAGWAEAAAAGVTEEVVAFARDAALWPELWLDFPLLPDDTDSDDFDMTDAQQDHALAVESVAPELADLRIELCPSHMSEGCFWKIYFVLLHPKLRKEDVEIQLCGLMLRKTKGSLS